MEFYYPNFQNDMWRIFGLAFFGDKGHFVSAREKCFRKEAITAFLTTRLIAIYDTAQAVVRHKDTASDKDLEIVEAVDIGEMARALPDLQNIVATGQKALDAIIKHFLEQGTTIPPPAIGACAQFVFHGRGLRLYRMPSSSRAYPLPLERKADIYRAMFEDAEGGGGKKLFTVSRGPRKKAFL